MKLTILLGVAPPKSRILELIQQKRLQNPYNGYPPGVMFSLENPRITTEETFYSQDEIFYEHRKNNSIATEYIEKSLNLFINKCWFCTQNEQSDGNIELFVFLYFFEDILSSLLVAYRISYWGSTSDAYAILRTSLEGLGFLSQVIDEEDFQGVYDLIKNNKLKYKHIIKKAFKDKLLQKEINNLSDLASHFTATRRAQGFYLVFGKERTRMGYSFYEQENDLTERLGTFLNILKYANSTIKRFTIYHHKDCGYDKFISELTQIEDIYQKLKKIKYPIRK